MLLTLDHHRPPNLGMVRIKRLGRAKIDDSVVPNKARLTSN